MYIYLICLFAGLSGLLFGYDTGVISGALLFIKKQFHLTIWQQEVVVSITLIGCIIGALFAGMLADRYSRRNVLINAAIIFIVGAGIMGLATNLEQLIIGRFIVGIGIGLASMTGPLYISELAPANIRGMCVSFNQLFLVSGICISYIVDYGFADTGNWRAMLAISAIPASIFLVAMLLLPKTPRWLISKGYITQAEKILSSLRANTNINKEINDIKAVAQLKQSSWREVFSSNSHWLLVIGCGLAIYQQITGINTILYYAPSIFQMAGYASASSAIYATMGIGVVMVLTVTVMLFLLDRIGRRRLLLLGLALQLLSLIMIGSIFRFFPGESGLIIWSLVFYIIGFAMGMGPIAWLIIAEIFPLQIRGRATSVATFCNWFFNLLVSISFLSLIHWIGKAMTFWIYGFITLTAIVFVYYFMPETMGLTLEKLESKLANSA